MKADAVIDVSKESFVARVAELTDGRGLDGVLEMSGDARAIRDGLAALRNGGRLSLLGLPREEFGMDWNKLLVFKGVTIHGIAGRRMYETWRRWSRASSNCARATRARSCSCPGGRRRRSARPGGPARERRPSGVRARRRGDAAPGGLDGAPGGARLDPLWGLGYLATVRPSARSPP